jgi:Holliday junction resolvase RusA-like endonuclease
MKEVYFIVDGRVQPKQRPRVYRNKYTGQAHAITPRQTIEYENKVKASYIDAEGIKFEGAVEMVVNIYTEIPKSVSKKKRAEMLLNERPITKTGDIDNLFKAISDALNGLAYDDDSQIVDGYIHKYYSEQARAEITIREAKHEI